MVEKRTHPPLRSQFHPFNTCSKENGALTAVEATPCYVASYFIDCQEPISVLSHSEGYFYFIIFN
jgi:hypothetical protein